MADTLVDLMMARPPTAERPLLGVMILVVEDSRFACDALRLICQRSGARIRRAESLASANRHLRAYLPRVAVVDVGLPDGSGLTLIGKLARSDPRVDAIIAMSGDDTRADAAVNAGADRFLGKPIASVSAFQSTVLSLLPTDSRPPHVAVSAEDSVAPDPIALKDDLMLAAELLSTDPDPHTLDYLAAFLSSLAQDAGDTLLADLGKAVAALRTDEPDIMQPLGIVAAIRARMDSLSLV